MNISQASLIFSFLLSGLISFSIVYHYERQYLSKIYNHTSAWVRYPIYFALTLIGLGATRILGELFLSQITGAKVKTDIILESLLFNVFLIPIALGLLSYAIYLISHRKFSSHAIATKKASFLNVKSFGIALLILIALISTYNFLRNPSTPKVDLAGVMASTGSKKVILIHTCINDKKEPIVKIYDEKFIIDGAAVELNVSGLVNGERMSETVRLTEHQCNVLDKSSGSFRCKILFNSPDRESRDEYFYDGRDKFTSMHQFVTILKNGERYEGTSSSVCIASVDR